MNAPISMPRATLDDLMRYDGGAELIGGRIVPMSPTGFIPTRVSGRIYLSLNEYAERVGRGVALSDGAGFAVAELKSGRESFSPDACYFLGPLPADGMDFIPGAPLFAAEIRSKGDYGPKPERLMALKRADYFEAGTLVVWDVDPVAGTVNRYRPGEGAPTEFRAGDEADAEPAAPGWRVAVDWLMK